jgi:hypothetical protein
MPQVWLRKEIYEELIEKGYKGKINSLIDELVKDFLQKEGKKK